MIFIGCDPGVTGAIAILEPNPPQMKGVDRVVIVKMPATERDVWRCFDPREHGMPFVGNAFAVIELLEPRPTYWKDKKTGEAKRSILRSTCVLMQRVGFLRCCLVASGIPFDEATPKAWQKAVGLKPKSDKRDAKEKAEALYPLAKGITQQTADALLLAAYAQRLHQQRTGSK